jgi:2-hydroxy-3-oxopropionate reductase
MRGSDIRRAPVEEGGEAFAEGRVAEGVAGGEDPFVGATFVVLSGGLAANEVVRVKAEKFLSHSFEPGGKVAYHRKDLRIALEAARELGVGARDQLLQRGFAVGALGARGGDF